MSNVKGLPGYVECDPHQQTPLLGKMHGYVRLLASSPRHRVASFFLNDRQFTVNRSSLPDWVKDGAHIEIETGDAPTITLITPARP